MISQIIIRRAAREVGRLSVSSGESVKGVGDARADGRGEGVAGDAPGVALGAQVNQRGVGGQDRITEEVIRGAARKVGCLSVSSVESVKSVS